MRVSLTGESNKPITSSGVMYTSQQSRVSGNKASGSLCRMFLYERTKGKYEKYDSMYPIMRRRNARVRLCECTAMLLIYQGETVREREDQTITEFAEQGQEENHRLPDEQLERSSSGLVCFFRCERIFFGSAQFIHVFDQLPTFFGGSVDESLGICSQHGKPKCLNKATEYQLKPEVRVQVQRQILLPNPSKKWMKHRAKNG